MRPLRAHSCTILRKKWGNGALRNAVNLNSAPNDLKIREMVRAGTENTKELLWISMYLEAADISWKSSLPGLSILF